jgi:hypothetical protein
MAITAAWCPTPSYYTWAYIFLLGGAVMGAEHRARRIELEVLLYTFCFISVIVLIDSAKCLL